MSLFSRFIARWNAPQGYRDVLRVGLPLVAGMVSSTVMQFTDRLFLSHYSVTSIAAALPSSMAAMVLQLPLVGLCGYVSIFIAQYIGAGRPREAGAILWQGLWMALGGTILLAFACLLAPPLFAWTGHPPAVMAEEIIYFRILTLGSAFFLLSSVVSGFFIGRGHTRPVLFANLAGAALNVPLDYALIFGAWGFPELGIAGAGIATVIGWAFCAAILGAGVFTANNDRSFHVFSAWRFKTSTFMRLLRFGGPSGINLFMEVAGFAWFILEVGTLGETALAASNIAMSVNTLVFMPMLGLNAAVAALVGQAMGRKRPDEARTVTYSALQLCFMYMVPLALSFFIFAGPLMDIFRPSDPGADFAPIRAAGVVLIYYIAVYSLGDACNIVFLGALKGAGDTLCIMLILGGNGIFALALPIIILKSAGLAHLHPLWAILTVYVMTTALCSYLRFHGGKWRRIRMVD